MGESEASKGELEAEKGCCDLREAWILPSLTETWQAWLTIIILEQNCQHLTAVQLVGIKRHLSLWGKEQETHQGTALSISLI